MLIFFVSFERCFWKVNWRNFRSSFSYLVHSYWNVAISEDWNFTKIEGCTCMCLIQSLFECLIFEFSGSTYMCFVASFENPISKLFKPFGTSCFVSSDLNHSLNRSQSSLFLRRKSISLKRRQLINFKIQLIKWLIVHPKHS